MKKLHKKIKLHLKQFRLFLGRLILDKNPSRPWDETRLPISKILFIRHDGKIGDFIVSSFIYREIKKQYPQIYIGVVAAAETKYLFDSESYIDAIYVTPRRSLLAFLRIGLTIRKKKYDVVVDLTEVLRNRDIVLIRCVNAAINIGYNQPQLALFNYNVTANNEHITQDYEKALGLLGFQPMERDCAFPNIPVSSELHAFCQKNLKGEYIAINFFGAANHKKFSPEQQLKWLSKLTASYPDKTILVLTYPQVTAELKLRLPNDKYTMYEGTTTIFDSIELIRNASLVISPDTSIIHIASAFNKPIIAFYMTSNPKNPYGKWMPMNSQNSNIYYYKHNINDIDLDQIKLN